MALQQPTLADSKISREDVIRVLLIVAAAIAVIVVATALIGMQQAGPVYDFTPDPAKLSGRPF
jgi:hypothetical protein